MSGWERLLGAPGWNRCPDSVGLTVFTDTITYGSSPVISKVEKIYHEAETVIEISPFQRSQTSAMRQEDTNEGVLMLG